MANNIIDSFLILFTTQVRGNGIQQLNKQTAGVMKNMSGAGNMLKMFFGYDLYHSLTRLIPSMISTSRELGAMHARFFAITNSTKLADEEFDWLTKQTQRLGLELMKTADNYSIFFATAKSSLGGSDTRKVYSDMLDVIRVLHITPDKMGQIFYAFREIASEGTLKLQRLTRQLGTSVPDAMNIAAKSMGYATDKAGIEKFRKAISAGAIDSKTFLLNFSKGVHAQFVSTDKLAEAMAQVDAQIQIMQNSWQLFQVKMSKGGFSKDLISVLKVLNIGMKSLEENADKIWKITKSIVGLLTFLFASRGIIGIAGWIKNVSLLIKEMGILTGVLHMLKIYTSFGAGANVAGFLIPLLTNQYVLGALLIIGLGILAKWVLHKFFPNVEKYLWTMLNRLILFLWNSWYALKADFDKSPFGKWVNEKYTTSGVDKALMEEGGIWKGDKKAKTEYDNNIAYETIAGKNDPLRRVLNMLTGGQLDKALNKTSYTKPQNNKMDVKIIFESKGEIPEEQVSALKNTIGTTFMNAVDVIINSKNNLSQPIKYTGTRPVANPV